eukprot:5616106-Prymnesium_polylepis.1
MWSAVLMRRGAARCGAVRRGAARCGAVRRARCNRRDGASDRGEDADQNTERRRRREDSRLNDDRAS